MTVNEQKIQTNKQTFLNATCCVSPSILMVYICYSLMKEKELDDKNGLKQSYLKIRCELEDQDKLIYF